MLRSAGAESMMLCERDARGAKEIDDANEELVPARGGENAASCCVTSAW